LAQKILPTQPYEHEYAEDFIKAAKRGDVEQLEAMLKEAKQLIFQFDSVWKNFGKINALILF